MSSRNIPFLLSWEDLKREVVILGYSRSGSPPLMHVLGQHLGLGVAKSPPEIICQMSWLRQPCGSDAGGSW